MLHKTHTNAHLLASCHLVLFQAPLTGPLSAPNDIFGVDDEGRYWPERVRSPAGPDLRLEAQQADTEVRLPARLVQGRPGVAGFEVPADSFNILLIDRRTVREFLMST